MLNQQFATVSLLNSEKQKAERRKTLPRLPDGSQPDGVNSVNQVNSIKEYDFEVIWMADKDSRTFGVKMATVEKKVWYQEWFAKNGTNNEQLLDAMREAYERERSLLDRAEANPKLRIIYSNLRCAMDECAAVVANEIELKEIHRKEKALLQEQLTKTWSERSADSDAWKARMQDVRREAERVQAEAAQMMEHALAEKAEAELVHRRNGEERLHLQEMMAQQKAIMDQLHQTTSNHLAPTRRKGKAIGKTKKPGRSVNPES